MKDKQGYFSLIQYSEYPERNEFVNIGVVLFSSSVPHVLVKFSESSARVKKVFGGYPGKHFEIQKLSMQDRIEAEFQSNWSRSHIEKFVGLRSGNIRLSSPKSVLVMNPNELLDELYGNLVEPISVKVPSQKIQTKLKNQLVKSGVESLLDKKPEPVALPQGVTIKVPYAYQNGSYNLISPVSLRDDPNLALAAAGKQAAEGLWLSDLNKGSSAKRLVVVGDVEGQQHNFVVAVKELIEKNNSVFYPLSDITPLANDIKKYVAVEDSRTGAVLG